MSDNSLRHNQKATYMYLELTVYLPMFSQLNILGGCNKQGANGATTMCERQTEKAMYCSKRCTIHDMYLTCIVMYESDAAMLSLFLCIITFYNLLAK